MVGSAGTLAAAPANAAEPTAGKTLFAWGANSDGQLGGGAARSTPDEVALELPPGVEVKAAVAGEKHNLAVTTDGALYGWGSNGSGQLGDGTLTRRPTPVRITLPDEAGVQAVAAGDNHSLAAATDGTLYAWGFNGSGQLGTGKVSNDRTPVKVALPDDVRVEAVAAGDNHSVALATNGSVYAWSYNGSGQLGDGTMSNAPTPVKVALPDDVRIEVVAAAGEHSVAVATDGSVYAWGNNVYGQLGDGTMNNASTPIKVAPLEGVKIEFVAAAGSHSLAVGSDGSAYAWGTNMYGQLGNGQNTGGRTPVEVALPDDVDAVAVAAADYHSLAVASDGSAYAWGYNASGQLGDGTKQDSLAPVEVKLPEGVEAGGVAAGLNHSLAIGEVAPEVQLEILDVTAEGSTVTVTGTGKPGTTITITLGDQTREATVGQDGTWTAVFNDVTPGNHSVTVTDENGNVLAESQDPVTVPEPEDPTPPTPPAPPAPPAPQPADTDGDGLTDAHEARLGTNPRAKDTDRDGLSDGQEVKGTAPFTTRTESKQRTRYFKTNPVKADTDKDGLRDGQERTRYKVRTTQKIHGYKTWKVSSNPLKKDTDRDGLTDKQERKRRLDPWDADTDGWFKKPVTTARTLHQPNVKDSRDRFPLNPRKA
jgi:alpha-tubulin suppressor-like RCC1 family protein